MFGEEELIYSINRKYTLIANEDNIILMQINKNDFFEYIFK